MMGYEEFSDLMSKMAVESYCIDAADAMITRKDALLLARQRKELTKTNPSHRAAQDWCNLERAIGNALIALEQLGYKVEKV